MIYPKPYSIDLRGIIIICAWTPKVCRIVAFLAVFVCLGNFSDLLLGSRYTSLG